MSSEQRTIRPYLGVSRIEQALGRLQLTVGKETLDAGGRQILDVRSFVTDAIGLVLAQDEDALQILVEDLRRGISEADLDEGDVDLIAVVTTGRLKLAEVVWTSGLADIATGELRVMLAVGSDRPKPFLAPFGGARIDVYAVVSKQLTPAPLHPWRRGTWLAHIRFELTTELGEIGFTPIPLTAELRKELQLPKGTIRFAVIEDPVVPGSDEESIRLYVDDEVLAEVNAAPNTPVARAFQQQLFLDAMSALISESSRLLNSDSSPLTIDDVEDSLLGTLIDRLVGPGQAEPSDARDLKEMWFRMVRDEPGRVRAMVEDWVPNLRRYVNASLREVSAT